MERRRGMFDPVLHQLHQARQAAIWIAQLMRVDPDLMMPAALPLLAARLMDAGGVEDDGEDGSDGQREMAGGGDGQTDRRTDGQTESDGPRGERGPFSLRGPASRGDEPRQGSE